ncbi:MAG TPA: hypothetical protein VFC02_26245, partial [Anaerolineales bacterium]|nr:hypothetical protein [Anaerolineales bacterium]
MNRHSFFTRHFLINRSALFRLIVLIPIFAGINFVPVPSLFLWNTTKQIVTSSLEPSRITFQEIASGLTKP